MFKQWNTNRNIKCSVLITNLQRAFVHAKYKCLQSNFPRFISFNLARLNPPYLSVKMYLVFAFILTLLWCINTILLLSICKKYSVLASTFVKVKYLGNVKGRFSGIRARAPGFKLEPYTDAPYFWPISDQINQNESVIIFF